MNPYLVWIMITLWVFELTVGHLAGSFHGSSSFHWDATAQHVLLQTRMILMSGASRRATFETAGWEQDIICLWLLHVHQVVIHLLDRCPLVLIIIGMWLKSTQRLDLADVTRSNTSLSTNLAQLLWELSTCIIACLAFYWTNATTECRYLFEVSSFEAWVSTRTINNTLSILQYISHVATHL